MISVTRTATLVAAIVLSSAVASALQGQDSTAARQQRTLDSLATALRQLQARLDSSATGGSGGAVQPSQAPRSGAYMNIGLVSLTDAGWSTERNVSALERGDHDPHVRGFTLPNTELTFDGAVDPYFKGFTNLVYKLDANGATGVELEEAYFITTSLPANLQLKVGQFFAEFGRQNQQHPHSWTFADQPLVLNRMFGAEGLRSQGARLSWLLPTSFFTEAMVAVMNSTGGTAYSFRSDESAEIHGGTPFERPVGSLRDLLVVPRLSSSFDLSETQTIVVGASGAFGPNNSGADTRTRIYGVDAYYKWKPAAAQSGFPFLSLQTEAMTRRYGTDARQGADAATGTLPIEQLRDRGAYAELLYGIRPRVVAGLRGDIVRGDSAAFISDARADRTRISPNFTWYPTEFSKVRFQYNFDDRRFIGTDHSFWIQFEFLLGAHAAHKF